jgi:hypothetical protein
MTARATKIGTRASRGSSARFAYRLAIVAALFVAQMLLGGHTRTLLPSDETLIEARYCESHKGDDAPAHEHGKTTHCCVLCASSATRDGPLHQIVASSPEIFSPPPIRADAPCFRAFGAEPGEPPEWKSSRSSRAPPLFS